MNDNHHCIITFVIPSLNRPTLGRTIESLLRQSNPNWKCIVVFDGCAAGVKFTDPRIFTIVLPVRQGKTIQVREQTCGQAGRVRNVGMKRCLSEWIGFVDDDDTLDPEYVNVLCLRYARLSHVEAVVWRMQRPDGVVLPPVECNILRRNYVGISFCFKRRLGVFFQNNSQFEDYEFLQKVVAAAGGPSRVLIAPEVFYYVNQDVPKKILTTNHTNKDTNKDTNKESDCNNGPKFTFSSAKN